MIHCCDISGNEREDWVCQNSLGSCWWSALFFHLCCSYRMLTPGVMPISPHSTLIINNPLELCSFYRNNRGDCLTNLNSNAESSAVHLIISACSLIGQKCEERLKTQLNSITIGAHLWFSSPQTWQILIRGSEFTSRQCLFTRVTCVMTLLSGTQKPIWPIKPGCICSVRLSVSTVWVGKYFESSWHPIREGPNMTSN